MEKGEKGCKKMGKEGKCWKKVIKDGKRGKGLEVTVKDGKRWKTLKRGK